jgi:translation initiation factor 2 subunit 2
LLDDAYKALPERKSSGERFETPVAITLIQGQKTIVQNFDQLCQKIRREPEDVAKHLGKELAAPSSYAGGRLTLNGKFSSKQINEKIQAFVESQVICKECKKPDTHLESHGDRAVRILICEACGAKAPVRK